MWLTFILFSEDADVEVDESLFQDMDDLDIEDDNDLDIDNSDGSWLMNKI